MALKLKLMRSPAGASDTHLRTLQGLGLWKFGQEKLLQDTPAIRGMVFKVKHLVSHDVVAAKAPVRKRIKPRRIRLAAEARKKREQPTKR